MYNSLKDVCLDFHLFIFAFDDKSYSILINLELEHVTVISLKEFEDQKLLKIKETRSKGEYCWTCTPSTILYCIKRFNLEHCTYLDSDLYFFNDPKILFDELGDNDVMITSHRYTKEFDKTTTSGKYCVQFMPFKNTPNGLNVLTWWRNACINWCYAKYEDGKLGDQMYLDDWTTRFQGIHELKHLGGGVAPWNMQQYTLLKKDDKWKGIEISSKNSFDLVFFHFHAFQSFKKGILREFRFHGYPLPYETKRNIYLPYISKLKKQYKTLKQIDKLVDGLNTQETNISWWKYGKEIGKRILLNDNKYTYWLN